MPIYRVTGISVRVIETYEASATITAPSEEAARAMIEDGADIAIDWQASSGVDIQDACTDAADVEVIG